MGAHAKTGIRWWAIPVAVFAALVTVSVGATQVLSGESSIFNNTGADIVMVAALLVMLIALSIFFTDFLRADEQGTVSAPPARWWMGPLAILGIATAFGLGATQTIQYPSAAIDSSGADIVMVAAILVFLTGLTVSFTGFLQADEHGEYETSVGTTAPVREPVAREALAQHAVDSAG